MYAIRSYYGIAADSLSNKFIATFDSATQAYLCALEISNTMPAKFNDLNIRMAIHAGNPVDGDPLLFGSALKLSNFMCNESDGSLIKISHTVIV